MFWKKENFFKENKTFIAIIIGALIIGGSVYFSGQKEKAPEKYLRSFSIWCRGTESNCRHGDFRGCINKCVTGYLVI